MILREATIKYKGYDPDELSHASERRVCCSCNDCGRVRYVRFNHYTDLCRSCTQRGKRNHAYGKGLFGEANGMYGKKHNKEEIEKQKQNQPNNAGLNNPMYGLLGKNNPNFGRICSEEQKKKQSKTMTGRYLRENAPNWRGGIAYRRDHLLTEAACIKLNKKFNNSHFHHITRSIGVYIPKDLHKHFYHSLKSGHGMGSMNMLALQFINGGL